MAGPYSIVDDVGWPPLTNRYSSLAAKLWMRETLVLVLVSPRADALGCPPVGVPFSFRDRLYYTQ
jgi:hypothetical protein